MIQYHNQILDLPVHGLGILVYEWEAREGSKCWIKYVKEICKNLHLPASSDGIIHDMENVQAAAHKFSTDRW